MEPTQSNPASQTPGPGGGFADGDEASARFNQPAGLAWEASQARGGAGRLLLADTKNHRIRTLEASEVLVEDPKDDFRKLH